MFGLLIKAPKLKAATNSVSSSGTLKEQKTHSQKKNSGKDKKIKAQTELIEKQKQEIENLKATQATGVSPQQLVTAIFRPCLVYMWVTRKFSPVKPIVAVNLWGYPDLLNHQQG